MRPRASCILWFHLLTPLDHQVIFLPHKASSSGLISNKLRFLINLQSKLQPGNYLFCTHLKYRTKVYIIKKYSQLSSWHGNAYKSTDSYIIKEILHVYSLMKIHSITQWLNGLCYSCLKKDHHTMRDLCCPRWNWWNF